MGKLCVSSSSSSSPSSSSSSSPSSSSSSPPSSSSSSPPPSSSSSSSSPPPSSSSSSSSECPICLDLINPSMKATTICNHTFCVECINKLIWSSSLEFDCPVCRKLLKSEDIKFMQRKQKKNQNVPLALEEFQNYVQRVMIVVNQVLT